MSDTRDILITSALPYANGPIHIGHLVEYIQTDIWARFQRMRGHNCWYVCADDAHGTPIMLRARQEGIAPEDLIARVAEEHKADFAAFRVAFDNYHSTHSPENRHYATLIYQRNRDAGHIAQRTITQAYDPVEQMFLPDRFIKGECPKCGAPDQYGDNCEACGASYSPSELKNPRSAVSGAVPEERESEHYFFKLGDFEDMLQGWTRGGGLQTRGRQQARGVVRRRAAGMGHLPRRPLFRLRDPGPPRTSSSTSGWTRPSATWRASRTSATAREARRRGSTSTPSGRRNPRPSCITSSARTSSTSMPCSGRPCSTGRASAPRRAVFAHGFLTVDGQKMSKSRGTFIKARTYLDHLDPEYLRYYFAAKLGPDVDDIDLNLEDFTARVNADLVGKVVNIASRTRRLHQQALRRAPGPRTCRTPPCSREFVAAGDSIAEAYERPRVQPRHARGHGAGRPRQPVHRRAGPLGHGQAARARGRTAPASAPWGSTSTGC